MNRPWYVSMQSDDREMNGRFRRLFIAVFIFSVYLAVLYVLYVAIRSAVLTLALGATTTFVASMLSLFVLGTLALHALLRLDGRYGFFHREFTEHDVSFEFNLSREAFKKRT